MTALPANAWPVDRLAELVGIAPPEVHESTPPEAPTVDLLSALLPAARWRRFDAPLRVGAESVCRGRPLVVLGAEGALVLAERRGHLYSVEDSTGGVAWLALDELASRLGVSGASAEVAFVAPEARDAPAHHVDHSPWREALTILRGDAGDFGSIVVYAIGVGLLSLALPLAVQTLVGTVAFGTVLQPIVVLAFLLAGGLVFAATLRALQTWVVELVQRRLFVRLVGDLGDRLVRVHSRAFEVCHGPELVNRFFDVFTAQKAVASLLLQGVEALLTAVFGLMVLALYHPILLGFGFAIVVGAAIVFVLLGKGATKTTIAESKAKYEVAGYLEEMARHLFALKLAGGGEHAMRHLDGLAAGWLSRRASHFRIVFRQILGALALQVIASATLLGLGGWLVVERELTIGQLVAAELIVTAVVASLSKLGGKLETVYDLVAASDKLGHLLHLPVERDGGELPRSSEGALRVEVQGLSSEGGELSDLDLTVDPGEMVAVSGDPMASSALVELLIGLREPRTGSVRIDGYDLRDVDLARLRRRVAVVRDAEVWPVTLAENLRAVATPVPVAAMWKALDAMGLGAFVRRLPLALHTPLVPSGAPLPRLGGMRLTLARALVADPGVLVLDGALDALPPGEGAVLLERLAKGRTVIVVTTDPDLAARASRRIVLRAEVRS
ncbi:MAG: ATP-binding cassette domain-containing protein [Sandaracinus sp.]|nr:ATP-binding cassette domain-containing protein [Sandaracinus sp.]MCB9633130.1 ATP-binding cassette domain-containing protein [Sandaracinus sp.]